LDYPTINLNPR